MRYVIAVLVVIGALAAPASAAQQNQIEFSSIDAVNRWISHYRAKPQPARLPAAVRALSQLGALKEPEGAGVYVGFVAGVIGANPVKAEEFVGRMAPIAPADQWLIVRAVAYSGHPDWQGLLRKLADRMPQRRVMIDRYVEGKLPTLDQVASSPWSPRSASGARRFA